MALLLKNSGKLVVLVVAITCLCGAVESRGESVAGPEKLPLYEYGLVGVAARIPHYIGSDESTFYAFPLPYIIYRGEFLQANRDGVRTIFWHTKKFELDISLSGNPPASDDKAREGMADLDGIGEIGPALNYYFYDFGERDAFLLQANVRAAFAIGFDDGVDIVHEGYVSDLSLIYKNSHLFSNQRIRFHASTGIRFGDAVMHEYFYGVSPKDATPDRQRYEASGGYGGFQVSGSIVKELSPDYSISGYARWNNIDGAVFEDSPLVRTHNNLMVGALFIWKIGVSEELEK
jgi:outer membrane scaffolding protein for murein synthesis (MipA/OmpV family)